MQVRKFEASSMKEALQLVKQELGPEAIILGAKDNKKSFGLAGKGSIEVTAAISEKALKKKEFTESRLPQEARDRFRSTSARQQKELIENTIQKYQDRQAREEKELARATTKVKRALPTRRYVDIGDDESADAVNDAAFGRRVEDVLEEFAQTGRYVLEDAANQARPTPARSIPKTTQTYTNQTATRNSGQSEEVVSLRHEVSQLREMLTKFQSPTTETTHSKPMTQHPGAEYGLPFELSRNFERLEQAGVDPRFILEILEKADKELTPLEKRKHALVDGWVARYILANTSVVGHWSHVATNGPQVHVYVGPGGYGKSTMLVKAAAHFAMKENKKVVIATTDTFKIGAAEQLKIFSTILNIPFETIRHQVEYSALCERYKNYDVILVDSPGFALKDIGEIDQLRSLLPSREIPHTTHLVLGSGMKDADAYEACQRFQVTRFDDLIATKLDESSNHGLLYNVQRKTEKPLYLFGVGTQIPEDVELATRERVLDLIYKITGRNHVS